MRYRRHVAYGGNGEAHGLQRAQRALAPRTRPGHFDFQRLHAVLARLAARILGGHLGGIRRGFPAALKALAAGRRPGDGVALRIGDRNHGVVERGIHVGHARRDVLAFLAARAAGSGGFRHGAVS